MSISERDCSAFLSVIETVVLFVRLRSRGPGRLPDEHLFDLMNAVHNVPEMLTGRNAYFTPDMIRDGRFAAYDAKWGVDGIGLVQLLDTAFQRFDAT
jgi:hypothetical protein